MSDGFEDAKDDWVSRYRQRRAERQALRADRRARRKASVGNPGDAAAQARSSNFQSGGYFTSNPPRRKP